MADTKTAPKYRPILDLEDLVPHLITIRGQACELVNRDLMPPLVLQRFSIRRARVMDLFRKLDDHKLETNEAVELESLVDTLAREVVTPPTAIDGLTLWQKLQILSTFWTPPAATKATAEPPAAEGNRPTTSATSSPDSSTSMEAPIPSGG